MELCRQRALLCAFASLFPMTLLCRAVEIPAEYLPSKISVDVASISPEIIPLAVFPFYHTHGDAIVSLHSRSSSRSRIAQMIVAPFPQKGRLCRRMIVLYNE